MDSPAISDQRPRNPAFRALRHRNFRLFFGGQLTSLIGTWMQTAAQSWLVLKLTNSPLMLGTVSFANYLPILLITLFAGVFIDRVDRRRLIILTQTLLMLSAFTLAGLTWTGLVRVQYVIALAAFNGVVSAFDMPGRQAFVVKMVGIEDLSNAIALELPDFQRRAHDRSCGGGPDDRRPRHFDVLPAEWRQLSRGHMEPQCNGPGTRFRADCGRRHFPPPA